MDKQFQSTRISDEDRKLIRISFHDNDNVLKGLRKVFLQMTLTETDVKLLAPVSTSLELQRILRTFLLPELDGDVGIGLNLDLWMTVSVTDKDTASAYLELSARNKLLEYLEYGFRRLKTLDTYGTGIIQNFNPVKVPAGLDDLIARNTLITHIEQKLVMLKMWAAEKDETEEQIKARQEKDSVK